jgi:hypothetical protein
MAAGTSGLLEVDGDGAEQPRQDHAVHPALVGLSWVGASEETSSLRA